MRRVGIMGGTFNPIHFAHLLLAEQAYEQFELDEVVFMPSKKPAYKPVSEILEGKHRLKMIQLSIQDNPHFTVSDMELNRDGNTYTVDTLQILTKENPEISYYFIIGGDSLFEIEKWKQAETVMSLAHIIAAKRDDKDNALMERRIGELNQKYHATIELLRIPNMEVSSRMLRERVKEGKSIHYLVPNSVCQYITDHGFYR